MLFLSSDGRVLIRGVEKLATQFYYDPDIATIGYGHAILTPDGKHMVSIKAYGRAQADAYATAYMMKKWGKTTITSDEADALFNEDMKQYTDAVNAVCDAKTYQCEFDAMVSLSFNIGVAGFGSSSVARLHKQGARKVGDVTISTLASWSKTPAAARPSDIQQAFVSWCKDDGKWSLGLFHRRVAELLVYGGHSVSEATKTAWEFKG